MYKRQICVLANKNANVDAACRWHLISDYNETFGARSHVCAVQIWIKRQFTLSSWLYSKKYDSVIKSFQFFVVDFFKTCFCNSVEVRCSLYWVFPLVVYALLELLYFLDYCKRRSLTSDVVWFTCFHKHGIVCCVCGPDTYHSSVLHCAYYINNQS